MKMISIKLIDKSLEFNEINLFKFKDKYKYKDWTKNCNIFDILKVSGNQILMF